jgi:hypothetical protein
MVNVGSISDQTLAGIVTTATHGSGITYGVMSTHVIAMTLLLADGTRVTCSRRESADLFVASICGLGSTGLILTIQLEVRSAFRLKEVQETVDFDYGMKKLDDIVSSAEHVRLWWFPTVGALRVNCADSTREARKPCLLYPTAISRLFPAKKPTKQLVMAFIVWTSRRSIFSVYRTLLPLLNSFCCSFFRLVNTRSDRPCR